MLIEVHESCFSGDNSTLININKIITIARNGEGGSQIKTDDEVFQVNESKEELHKLINEIPIKAQEEALERHRIMLVKLNPTVENGGMV